MSEDRLDKIILLLGQVDGKVTALAEKFDGHTEDDTIRFGKLEMDLQAVNKKINWGSGFASGVGAIVGSVATFWFKGH
jgi:uncharacterized protein (UPF0548 family)